jgi:aerobic carbon-monoxide dehydrogenase large subunit
MVELGAPRRPKYIGVRLPRVEDRRLAAGRHRYTSDMQLPGMLEVAIVRSPYAHARITAVDVTAARELEGVLAVVSAADMTDASPVPDYMDWAGAVRFFPLSHEKVRYVGAPVAAVVATDRYLAEDAVELVQVEYEELPAVTTIEGALAPDAPRLYEDWPDNRMIDFPLEDPATTEAFAKAVKVVGGRFPTQRFMGVPMETRASIARFEDGRLTLWSTTQIANILRTVLSAVLGMPERDLRVVAPDLGGGFGAKAAVYPEELLVAWLAKRLRRPVRYLEDRIEHLLASGHSRDQMVELEAALDGDGLITAIRGTVTEDVGSSEIYPAAFAMAMTTAGGLTGPYRIGAQAVGVTAVVTNKAPASAYRGFGLPEAVFAMERLIDKIADETGADRLELRRRMMLRPEDVPFETASGAMIDSGSHLEAFERVIEMGDAELEEAKALYAEDPNVRIGVGYANYVEGSVPTYLGSSGKFTSQESCSIRFEPDGSVTIGSGVHAMGQGIVTMITMVTADALGVAPEDVQVVIGDTDRAPFGLGSWGARSTGAFGGAFVKAVDIVTAKGAEIAAGLLEADAQDVVFDAGRFHIAGSTENSVGWTDVANAAYFRTDLLPKGVDPGIETTAWYDPPVEHEARPDGKMNAFATYANASHAAIVKVELDTGDVQVLKYLVTNDCGTIINPMIVEGQIRGGVAQGIGGTLLEELVYDDQGQPLSTTFADYLLPTATEIPRIEIEHFETPAPNMAFGAKGCGEAGVQGPSAAIAMAVENALEEFGVTGINRTPLSPPRVLQLLDEAQRTRTA